MNKVNSEIEGKIIELYQSDTKNSMSKIGKMFNINAATVLNILRKNNIPTRSKGGHYPFDVDDIVRLYKNGISSTVIAQKYNVSIRTITNILDSQGIKRDNIYHNLTLQEDYWSKIDSIDKAYFLGFMLSDGNVVYNAVSLQLSSKDKEILEVFSKKTGNTNKLCEDKRGLVKYSVKRTQWVEDLAKYGVVPRKTYIATMPTIDDNLMPHMVRGLIDGDGWISVKSHQLGFCGTESMVTSLRDYLCTNLDIFKPVVLKTEDNLWQVTWASRSDIKKIDEFIYRDKEDCYLKRKFNNFIDIIHGNTEVNLN